MQTTITASQLYYVHQLLFQCCVLGFFAEYYDVTVHLTSDLWIINDITSSCYPIRNVCVKLYQNYCMRYCIVRSA